MEACKKEDVFTKNKKLLFLLLIIVVLCVFYFLFGLNTKKQSISSQNSQKQHVIVALGSEPRTLDPRRATDANGMRIVGLLFQSLVRIGPRLEIQPSAARTWSYKNKTYTFFIDKHLTFSNGRKINKEDILFSFEEYRSEKSPFSSAFEIIESVDVAEKAEQYVLSIKLKTESAKFLSSDLPVLKILPKTEVLSSGSDFQKQPIGTGLFRLETRDSSQLVLTARTNQTPSPKINKVTFKIIRDDFTRFQKMLNKEIDIAQSEISFQKINYFLDKKNHFQVFRRPGLSMTYLLINFKDECLKKKDMREVMALSLNRLEIIQHKLNDFARIATTILGPNNFFFNKSVANLSYDPKKATEILSHLPVSCRQKTFSLKTSNARSAMDHGKVLALQLKKAGLKIKMESFEWGTFYGDLNAGRFQLALLKWVGAIDPDIYRLAFHSKEHPPKGRNRGFYHNETLDQLLDQGITVMDREQRRIIYNQVQKIIHEDLVFIPLWHEDQITVVQKSILHYHLSDNGDFHYLTEVAKDR